MDSGDAHRGASYTYVFIFSGGIYPGRRLCRPHLLLVLTPEKRFLSMPAVSEHSQELGLVNVGRSPE